MKFHDTWRPLKYPDDLNDVHRIATVLHQALPERPEVFAEKMRLFPEGCLKVCGDDGDIVGYAIAHPWRLRDIPALNAFLVQLPSSPDCLYIHDVAILPEARGRGLAGLFIDAARSIAHSRNIARLACVSVYGADALWRRYGFEEAGGDALAEKLRSYGGTARYLVAAV